MKQYIEFRDEGGGYHKDSAVDQLNKFIKQNENKVVRIIEYHVVRYESFNSDRTYILVEVE